MRRLLNKSLLILALIPSISFAQETKEPLKLSLSEAMNLAVKNNVSVKNARLDRAKQKALNSEVTGIAYPQINAKGEYSDYLNPIQSFVPAEFIGGAPGTFAAVPFTPKHSATASATATQILFDGSVMVALQARNTLLELYDKSTSLTEQEVRYAVQKGYYGLVVAKQQYETLKETMTYIRAVGTESKAYYENGFFEKIDVDRINVQINNLVSDSIKVGNLISVSEQMLKYQLGLDLDIPIELTDNNVKGNISEAKNLLLNESSLTDRTDYMLLQTQFKLNQYDIKRHQLSGLPSLAAFGTAAYTYQTNYFDDLLNKKYVFYSLVGLRLNVPIFDGWQRRSKVKQAKITLQQTRNKIDDLERGIKLQNTQSRTILKNALYTLSSQEKNYALAKSVLETARKKFNAGVGASSEVTQAHTDMLSAQSNYFQAMLDVINAQSDLQKSLGQFK